MLVGFLGCGGKVTADMVGQAGSAGSAGTGGTGGAPSTGGTGGSGGWTDSCEAVSEQIAKEIDGKFTCTSIVRIDHSTYEILGFQVICGEINAITEAEARQRAVADTGFGSSGPSLSGSNPSDEFVFYEIPADIGGAAAVSARLGQSVFGGSIIWGGYGEITYPPTWRPSAALGPGCPTMINTPPPNARGYDLRNGSNLDPAEVEFAVNAVWNTALPTGLMKSHNIFDAVVLFYPRSVGVIDPPNSEWIVMYNSGWLE